MTGTRFGVSIARLTTVLVVAALAVATGLWWIFSGDGQKHVTAYFTRAVGVYTGSDVRLLGVKIGQIDTVTPRGTQVEVTMSIDGDVGVAADTTAVVVAPSVVADRYLQLSSPARRGPRLPDGAVIPVGRTATPVELDQLYSSLNTLTTALGPQGANKNGALTDLLNTGASNLDGNGQAFNDTVRNFSDLARTLAGSKDDLFGTIDELQKFTGMLAGNDDQVRQVNQQLAAVLQNLAGDRTELSSALATLGTALGQIQGFIKDNRALLKSNVDKLARSTQVLVDRRAELSETLDTAPLAVTNILNAFDPGTGRLRGRSDLLEYFFPANAKNCPAVSCAPAAPQGMTALGDGQAPPPSAPPLPLPITGSAYVGGGR
jgi:phospholipid/cholesterol/gamma-HCH transport system substrate-binding protein